MTVEDLLNELRPSRTDLARLVEAVARHRLPQVVLLAQTVVAWQQRDPAAWAKVSEWLAACGAAVVIVRAARHREEMSECPQATDGRQGGAQ